MLRSDIKAVLDRANRRKSVLILKLSQSNETHWEILCVSDVDECWRVVNDLKLEGCACEMYRYDNGTSEWYMDYSLPFIHRK